MNDKRRFYRLIGTIYCRFLQVEQNDIGNMESSGTFLLKPVRNS